MSNSVNYSDIIAQIQQRCRIEGRQPTLEDYNDVISFLQQTSLHFQQENAQLQLKNSHLLQHYTHLMQANEICKVKCTHLSEDNKISQEILLRKHLEVEELRKMIALQSKEIERLNATVDRSKKDASDTEKNLEDVMNTNNGLLNQISRLQSALNEKDKQIAALLEQHNQKNKENKSLFGDQEHCQCNLKAHGEVTREPAVTSISTDSLSTVNLPQSMSHLSVTETTDKYSFCNGKQGSNSGVFITRKIASTKVNDSLSNVDLQQLHPSKTGVHDDHSELCISDDSGFNKCNHFDEEQQAMMGKTLHTTAKTHLQCKMKTGRLHCNSADLHICLKCGVTCCREHLYERHSKEHTIFMGMKTKKAWCFACKCDPFLSNSLTSLNKEKSSKRRDKNRARKQHSNDREEINRKAPYHYRPKSASWSSSETAEVATVWQSPLHNSPLFVPTSTGSATSTASYSATGKAFSDRQALNSPSNISSAAITSSNNLSTSYTSSPGIAQDLMSSSDVPANSNAPICIGRSNISTVTCDSLPVITMPVVTKIDAPPTVVMEPHIGGKQTNDTVASDSKLSGKSNLKSEILKAPIKPTIKSTGTTPTTAIVPVAHSSHRNTSYTNNWKNLTIPPNSKSKINTSTNSTQCVSSSASETESLKHTSRPSHKRSSSFDTRNRTATKSGTSSVNENENSLPADTNTPSVDSLRRRSWSLDSQILYGLPPFKGLINTGLTCFFNAAVQGLSRIKQFNGLLTKLWKQSDRVLMDLKKLEYNIEVIIPETKHGEVSRHLSKAIDNIRKPPVTKNEAYFDPSFLFSSIQAKYRNSFRQYRQGDAHELMRCILDAVRMEEIEKVKRGIKQYYTGSQNGDAENLPNGEDKMHCKAALRGAHKLRTYIDQVIGGELLSVVVCENCKYEAELIEPFLDISLPIPEKNTVTDCTTSCSMTQNPTLEECFEEYTSVDILDNDNKFICSSCSGEGDEIQLRKAKKQLQLQTLPKVFIIHLKRFSIDHIVTKNSTHVKYSSNIDVKPYCAKSIDEKQSTQYSLFAVVQHIGSLNFGHYTAYVKMEDTGLWYKADDSLISEVQEREALRQEAYLLFYQQRS